MSAASLLSKKAQPTDADIDEAMRGNICRCGTYGHIRSRHPSRRRAEGRRQGMTSIIQSESPRLLQDHCRPEPPGLMLAFALPEKNQLDAQFPPPPVFKTTAYIHIGKDESVTFILPKAEMGQGSAHFAIADSRGRVGRGLE